MKTIKKIKYLLIVFLAIPLIISCNDDTIEFEIKDSFNVGVSVHSDGDPTHFLINPTSVTIDVSDVIEGKNIKNLEVTGVTLKLNNDFRSSSQNSNFAPGSMLPANIDVKLELGTGSKQLFLGNKNLVNEVFQDLELITPVAIEEFLGSDNKVKLKIVLKFPEVYLESSDFTLDMVVKVRAITSGI